MNNKIIGSIVSTLKAGSTFLKNKLKNRSELLNSISFKVSLIYIALAIISISFFTSIIFENQIDLITDNARLQGEKFVNNILSSLKKYSLQKGSVQSKSNLDRINEMDSFIKPLVSEYMIFSESGNILKKSHPNFTFPSTYLQDGLKSVTNQDFTGNRYYLKIDENSYKMFFYIPLKDYIKTNLILYLVYDISTITGHLGELNSQALVIFIITTLIHILFAFLLYRVVVRPIQRLHSGITEISAGNLTARVDIDRQDEIGAVALAFNKMGKAIQKNLDTIEEMAITDELTGLFNRRYLFSRIEEEIRRTIRRDYDLSLIMIDIDHFKNFNDKYGHQTGDLVLKEVSLTIKEACKDTDIVARYGGEEIAVIALDCPMDELLTMSERIRSNVEKTKIETPSGRLSVTISLGGTCFNNTLRETIGTTETLIFFADTALYRAKEKGRNRVEIG